MPRDTDKILDLSLGETELLPPLAISTTAQSTYETRGLEARHVERLSQLLGVSLQPRDIVATAGASQGLLAAVLYAIRALPERPTQLLTFSPYYPGYKSIADLAGLNLVTIPIARWLLEGEALFERSVLKKSILLVNSPHNPTGTTLSYDILARLARKAKEAHSLLIWDAAYLGVASEPSPNAALPDNTVLVGSFSKLLGLAGERVGFLTGAPEMTECIARAQWGLALSAPATGMAMACARLDTLKDSHIARCHSLIASNKTALSDFLFSKADEEDLDSGPFMWVEQTLTNSDILERFAARNIKVATGPAFGANETAFRLNLMVLPSKARDLIERLGA